MIKKTPIQILKDKFLLIEDDKTCEAHTHLVVEAMEEYLKQEIVEKKAIEGRELKEQIKDQLICSKCKNTSFRCYVTMIIDDARFYCNKCGYLELS